MKGEGQNEYSSLLDSANRTLESLVRDEKVPLFTKQGFEVLQKEVVDLYQRNVVTQGQLAWLMKLVDDLQRRVKRLEEVILPDLTLEDLEK